MTTGRSAVSILDRGQYAVVEVEIALALRGLAQGAEVINPLLVPVRGSRRGVPVIRAAPLAGDHLAYGHAYLSRRGRCTPSIQFFRPAEVLLQ